MIVRDQEWQVEEVERQALGTRAIVRCSGRSELVRGQRASFFTDIDLVVPEDPSQTKFRLDLSPRGIETRLLIESMVRRTPVPISNSDVLVGHRALIDDLPFQREPFRKVTEQLQPRILIADAVGLGKTIEVGIMLTELQRRGRANRVLVVVPRHILDQVQHELWCRFGFPLVRLDSEGIQRLRQRIPVGRNPFAYYNRAIVSLDTIKNAGMYRHHLEKVRWDVVWIDESHKLVNRGTLNNQLAQVLAPNADALILSSATPHNGKAESFAELVSLLDPTAVPDPTKVTADDIAHLVVRRHKHSSDVAAAIGDKWAERLPPKTLTISPSEQEERIFSVLSEKWVISEERRKAGEKSVSEDPLFPYTLLKAALSSPEALNETVERRLTPKRLQGLVANQTTEPSNEESALLELWRLSAEARDGQSAKLNAIIETLREIGVGPKSSIRAVIFSERIATLDWIAKAIRTHLNMNEEAVVTFHNSKSDEDQQRIVEDFSMATSAIRVLVTSDIAAEGVNLHKQCHHLIHADLPWSLITTTQRNGRIDRYGQLHSPEIRYLVYLPNDPEIASDVRVLKKLIEKEHEAHIALGDAASVMGLHSEKAEEAEIIAVLRKGNESEKESALESVAPTVEKWNPWTFVGLSSTETDAPPPPVLASIGREVSLFEGDDVYLEAALRLAFENLQELDWATDGPVLSFIPPDDLVRRLDALPQSYLRQRDLAHRLRLTVDPRRANQSLIDALNSRDVTNDSGTAWPEIHHLGPQHPVLDWVADKILYRTARGEAPALSADVADPVILLSGVWSNSLGEPIAAAWLAGTIEDGMVVFGDMFEALSAAGITNVMVNAPTSFAVESLSLHLPQVVVAATAHLENQLEDQIARVRERLELTKARLSTWQAGARAVTEAMAPGAQKNRRLEDIDRVTRRIESLVNENSPASAPLIRVLGALIPRG